MVVFPKKKKAISAFSAVRGRDDAHIILTVRADGLRHGGQVSLPGGVVDPGETFEQAALREAHEEVALPLDDVRVLGPLTPLDIAVSGFRLHPIIAVGASRPLLTASDGEVARILEVSLDDLLDGERLVTTERKRDGIVIPRPPSALRTSRFGPPLPWCWRSFSLFWAGWVQINSPFLFLADLHGSDDSLHEYELLSRSCLPMIATSAQVLG